MKMTEQGIQKEEITSAILERIKKYDGFNTFELFAMFMGKAQILEFGLKNLLGQRCGYNFDKMKRWTLGTTTKHLKDSGLRSDFIKLLESVVTHRNYIAHELLANDAIIKSITGGRSGRLEIRHLEKAIYELEQIILFHDWCVEYNEWD
ncbi:hypothetical protein [Azovibrio restrictus]|uniref:hypothetical protein n=1 Tax=Azovibrio restrictus TaxID=146938 RepID=UPI001B7FF064|nr:hypothetical protein [Azovibrio restrictus]